MLRYFVVISLFICQAYSYQPVNIPGRSASACDLKEFKESAEEFLEQISTEILDIDLILGDTYEFLEHSFPDQHPAMPSLIQNHNTYSSPLMPHYAVQKMFYKKAGRIIPFIDEYLLTPDFTIYHPPQS